MNRRTGSLLLRCSLGVLLIAVMTPFGVTAVEMGDKTHAALAAAEITGALLLMIPRTVVAGGATLLACVAFALAVQHGTHGSIVPLCYLALLLVALMLLDQAQGNASRKEPASRA
jgi:hypothetical protein